MTTAEALVAMLAAAGLGSPGVTCFAGLAAHLPPGPWPAPITRVVEYAAEPPDATQDDPGWALGRPRCQITVHAATYALADAQAQAQAWALAAVRDAVVGGVRFLAVRPIQTPFDLGPDGAGGTRVAFNVAVLRAD